MLFARSSVGKFASSRQVAASQSCQSRLERAAFGWNQTRHMWTASWQAGFDGLIALVGCGHMSGLWCGIGPLALMIFDSPGPYHCGELGSS